MSESPANHYPTPLRSALKTDDDGERTPPVSGTLKAVQIAEPSSDSYIDDDSQNAKHGRRAVPVRRLSGRISSQSAGASGRSSANESPAIRPVDDPQLANHSHHHSRRAYQSEKLLAQVGEWLERERKKAASKKVKPRRRKSKSPPSDKDQPVQVRPRSGSIDSDSSEVSLDGLQTILESSMSSMGLTSIPRHSPRMAPKHRRVPSRSSLHRTASSDTDYVDGDIIVPSCDAWLDNAKTLNSIDSPSTDNLVSQSAKVEKEREAWLAFKNDILRIAHTLRLKGWRRVPLGRGDTFTVTRLSGALTNAVYVVTPPIDMPHIEDKKRPTKVLLRIYGPQIEHLIDRENELHVLQRLARKKIGPRLLGTFKNGRFEQFFNAITLTPWDLRIPETYKQIAKRMRELHDGIDLLPHEKEGGPGVWRNWDQWLDTVSKKSAFLDAQLDKKVSEDMQKSVLYTWRSEGYVCGAPWEQFKAMVDKYRAYVDGYYENQRALKQKLVFAHNDTQHGNILRIRPDDEKSPLLQPANKHKQLIVIDFEYAAANTAGIEFANHFGEWSYHYTDPVTSWAFNADRYPTVEERRRFIKAYVDHRPQFPHASSTPRLAPLDSGTGSGTTTPRLLPTTSSSSIVEFMLDARYPGGDWSAAERAREEQSDKQVQDLMDETNLWRLANSAHWVAWGIVQAKIPAGMDGNPDAQDEELGPDEFDYLRYAQDRSFFFWGDCVQKGLVTKEELPQTLQDRLKFIEF
ncbi:Choline kinase [Cladobotryum mycophilum]|uniref:Choline kinase n=1 Tax=Cladobotryum mycophilum TaxID=491253 RepID=A0ABR0SGH4_9HYPO